MLNIDADIENADWPKRTPDTFADLGLRAAGSPNQPRDEDGRWVGYHGSRAAALAEIKQHGLVPHGIYDLSKVSQLAVENLKKAYVYITTDLSVAHKYAAEYGEGKGVVLRVTIPPSHAGVIEMGYQGFPSTYGKFKGKIPPEWIEVQADDGSFRSLAAEQALYLIVFPKTLSR